MDSLYGISGNFEMPEEVTREFVENHICDSINGDNAIIAIIEGGGSKNRQRILKSILADIRDVGCQYIPFYIGNGERGGDFAYYNPFVVITSNDPRPLNTEVLTADLRGKYCNCMFIDIHKMTENENKSTGKDGDESSKWHYFVNPSPQTVAEKKRRESLGEKILNLTIRNNTP